MTTMTARSATKSFFEDLTPTSTAPQEWVTRGGNFAVAYARCDSGTTLEYDGADEYFLFLSATTGTISWNGQSLAVAGRSLTVVPPGASSVSINEAGDVVRIFTARSAIASTSSNETIYADGAPELAPATPWPDPVGGWQIKSYKLDDYLDKKFRLFRSPNLMVNIFDKVGPRDTSALTPHSHTDFEQGSLAVAGDWVHSLRYPWTPRLNEWREDDHWTVGSPSLLIIPATVIHTSRTTSQGVSQLVDIFSPPRRDFSEAGLVCNADDFPMPA